MAALGLSGATALLLAAACLGSGCSFGYYAQSIGGHLDLLQRARPVNEVMADTQTGEALRERLALTQRLRVHALERRRGEVRRARGEGRERLTERAPPLFGIGDAMEAAEGVETVAELAHSCPDILPGRSPPRRGKRPPPTRHGHFTSRLDQSAKTSVQYMSPPQRSSPTPMRA